MHKCSELLFVFEHYGGNNMYPLVNGIYKKGTKRVLCMQEPTPSLFSVIYKQCNLQSKGQFKKYGKLQKVKSVLIITAYL